MATLTERLAMESAEQGVSGSLREVRLVGGSETSLREGERLERAGRVYRVEGSGGEGVRNYAHLAPVSLAEWG